MRPATVKMPPIMAHKPVRKCPSDLKKNNNKNSGTKDQTLNLENSTILSLQNQLKNIFELNSKKVFTRSKKRKPVTRRRITAILPGFYR